MSARVTVAFKDGTSVLLRPVMPEDKGRISSGLLQMSPQSRYFRFFSLMGSLSGDQLRYLTEVDQVNHVAWIAVDPATPQQSGMGIARFICSPANPRTAEAAFAVIDAWQHKGLGTYLAGVLYLRRRKRSQATQTADTAPPGPLV